MTELGPRGGDDSEAKVDLLLRGGSFSLKDGAWIFYRNDHNAQSRFYEYSSSMEILVKV